MILWSKLSREERIEHVKPLWLSGLSASQIANTVQGASRNAIIGVAHRAGLHRLDGKASMGLGHINRRRNAPAKAARPAPEPKPPKPPKEPKPLKAIARPPELPVDETPVRHVEEAPGLATVLTIRAGMCKWPIGDPLEPGFTLCGAKAEGSYCQAHRKRAYQPAQAKKRTRYRAGPVASEIPLMRATEAKHA
jgi:GcrA cell cycle regulator